MTVLTRSILLLSAFAAVLMALPSAALAVTIQSSKIATGEFRINQTVSYDVVLEGTSEAAPTNYPYIVYLTGTDIYGNTTYIQVERGTATGITGQIPNPGGTPTDATTFRITGAWKVPADGTLYNIEAGYTMVVAVYAANFPTALADLTTTTASSSNSPIKIDVTPNLAISTPGITYPAGSYRGKDIIQFTGSWYNNNNGETRPLRPTAADRYTLGMRLTTDPEYRVDTGTNDDFSLFARSFSGDGPLRPDGTTQYRKISVSGTPGKITAYGITGIAETERDYTPQPDDGFLDMGESVSLSAECLIPENYSGRYFGAARVAMDNPDFDGVSTDNTFVSNAANKIEILETASPIVEAASAISTETGTFVQGGDAASDFGAVNESGDIIAFASRASNLLVPPGSAGTTVPAQYATSGQQIFLKYRQTREVFLASRNNSNLQANADCFNPAISANGRYVAYDSAASNLVNEATGGRSMIYVFDATTGLTINVSKNPQGQPANGSCFNPYLSESGRFVVFESLATNLDLPQFAASLSGGGVSSTFTKVRSGQGAYNAAAPPKVTFTGGGGSGAAATATVGPNGTITGLVRTSAGSGYTSAPTITIDPPPAGIGQVFLHDRDTDADGSFDETGATATYLVSLNRSGAVANSLSYAPAVNLDDSNEDITANNGVFVTFVSYGRNMPSGTGYAMVYRTRVNVTGAESARGPVPSSLTAVSLNDLDEVPTLTAAEVNAGLKPDAYEPCINGDGTQIAFTSWGSNLVYNPQTGLFDADTNGVQDIFVRNFRTDPATTTRVSISQERVATGTITFLSSTAPGNVPDNLPAIGDTVTISDGVTSKTFTFAATGGGDNVPVGATVQEARDNLVAVINASGLNLIAVATNPPNVNPPGTGYVPSIYIKNLTPGTAGNVEMLSSSLNIAVSGMGGGGTQATDAPAAVQGVPFGSNQPSIDRSGRFVAFRSIAENLDVHIATDANSYPTSPITGELIRPLIFPTSNVYVHDRLADADEARAFDLDGNIATTRVSLNKFGYETKIFGEELTGLEATTSANSSSPSLSANGRFVAFSSDSEGAGGLIFGPNNMTPLDNTKFRDVFVHDRSSVGDNPPQPTTKPMVEIYTPPNGITVVPNTTVDISCAARAFNGKFIVSAELYVNNVSQGVITEEPFTWSYTPRTTGSFDIRVLVTDSKGISSDSSISLLSKAPSPGDPVILMTQPLGKSRYVSGSQFFLNAQVTATGTNFVVPHNVQFLVNGTSLGDTESVKQLGNKYGYVYTASVPLRADNFIGIATFTNGASTNLFNSPPINVAVSVAQQVLPETLVIDTPRYSPAIAGGIATLQAQVISFGRDPQLEFYVNNVYVGNGSPIATNLSTGGVIYGYDWRIPEVVSSSPGPLVYKIDARGVDVNYSVNLGTSQDPVIVNYYASSVSKASGALPVYYVPTDVISSDERFVIDYFTKVLMRRPTYDEYSFYLAMLKAGATQADVVMAMFNDAGFKANQKILFGYYLRMGLTPNVNQVISLLSTMTNAAGQVLLPSTMSAGVALTGLASPYGATVGQSEAAQALINSLSKPWGGSLVKNLDNQSFMNWMLRSFNQPYLAQDFPTNQTPASIGNQQNILNTIGAYAPTNTRFGAAYAFMSGLYSQIKPGNVSDTNLRAALTNFAPLVQGIAATYLLSPATNNWTTNAGPISTNMIAGLLPPVITNGGTNTIPINIAYSNAIGGQNLVSNTVYYASNLPAGLVVSKIGGVGYIVGTPSASGTNVSTIYASNGPGLVGSNTVTFDVLPPPASLMAATFTGVVGEPFSAKLSASNAPTNFSVQSMPVLPNGLSLDAVSGVISGTPTSAGTTTNRIAAFNRAGGSGTNIVIKLEPAFASWSAKYGLSGVNALAGADPDNDGTSNLREFAFGMNPSLSDALPVDVSTSSGNITVTWVRRKNTLIGYAVQSSPAMDGPTAIWESVTPAPTASKLADIDDNYERVRVQIPITGTQRFYRVQTSLPSGVF